MARDIIPISEAWLTSEMMDELHWNLTILYDSDQLEWLSYEYEKEWTELVDSWHLNTTFIELWTEAYTRADLDEETDEDSEDTTEEVHINNSCTQPNCPYCNQVDDDIF